MSVVADLPWRFHAVRKRPARGVAIPLSDHPAPHDRETRGAFLVHAYSREDSDRVFAYIADRLGAAGHPISIPIVERFAANAGFFLFEPMSVRQVVERMLALLAPAHVHLWSFQRLHNDGRHIAGTTEFEGFRFGFTTTQELARIRALNDRFKSYIPAVMYGLWSDVPFLSSEIAQTPLFVTDQLSITEWLAARDIHARKTTKFKARDLMYDVYDDYLQAVVRELVRDACERFERALLPLRARGLTSATASSWFGTGVSDSLALFVWAKSAWNVVQQDPPGDVDIVAALPGAIENFERSGRRVRRDDVTLDLLLRAVERAEQHYQRASRALSRYARDNDLADALVGYYSALELLLGDESRDGRHAIQRRAVRIAEAVMSLDASSIAERWNRVRLARNKLVHGGTLPDDFDALCAFARDVTQIVLDTAERAADGKDWHPSWLTSLDRSAAAPNPAMRTE